MYYIGPDVHKKTMNYCVNDVRASECANDERILAGEVLIVAGSQPHAPAALDSQRAVAIQFQLFCGVGRYVALI
jgi:hypothetical protein